MTHMTDMTDMNTTDASHGVSLVRIYLLRACYFLIAFVMGSIIWSQIIGPHNWPLGTGLAKSMLAALSLLCVVGVIYPLQMLPLLFFEIAWKLVWMLAIALPAWTSGRMDDAILQTFYECVGVLIIPLIIPWGYVAKRFLGRP